MSHAFVDRVAYCACFTYPGPFHVTWCAPVYRFSRLPSPILTLTNDHEHVLAELIQI